MHKVKVRIKSGGKVEIKVEGMPGRGCQITTKDLEESLGKKISDVKTGEYYEEPNQQYSKQAQR